MHQNMTEQFYHLVEQHKESLAQSFSTCIDTAWEQYQALQQTGKKGTLNYAYLSFLRTGVLLQNAWFRIDLLDHRAWGDVEDCSADWDTSLLTNVFYQIHHGQNSDREITISEQNQRLLEAAENLVAQLAKALPGVINEKLSLLPNKCLYFGEYMASYRKI